MQHVSVLLKETIDLLAPSKGDSVLDVTLGLGGHAFHFLSKIGASGTFVGLDADEKNLTYAKETLSKYSNARFIHSNFSELPECLPEDCREFDVILADLGLSSPHIDDPERGFTFRTDSPLDMRFDQSKGESAARVLQASDPITLRRIFKEFGELPKYFDLVDAIVKRRSSEQRVQTSKDLRDVVTLVYGYRAPKVLPQVFQALRIYVNDELRSLERLLQVALQLLSDGGRFGVISYHSLEDRIVKNVFRNMSLPQKDSLTGSVLSESRFSLLTKKPMKPTDQEMSANPRSRSAIFRAIQKSIR